MKSFSLKGKTTLITGASRGIGRATAFYLAKFGCDVALNYKDYKNIAELVKRLKKYGVRAFPSRADISSPSQVDKMVERVMEKFKKIDILVNNAGIWTYAPIERMTDRVLKETMDTNLNGIFYLCRSVVPQMKKRRSGNIINVSSTAGQRGESFHSHYAATKGGLISFTKSLAVELAPYNIRVNCVAPGWVDTDMSHQALLSSERQRILNSIPLGRPATAEEIAGSILFLASDLATYITGEILNVNGGSVLCG